MVDNDNQYKFIAHAGGGIDQYIYTNSLEAVELSIKKGFMQHNGGLFFRKISKNEYEFKTKIKKNHLNAAGITHGGYIASIIDAGAGTAAHRSANKLPCVTIALDIKFVGITKLGENISGFTKILKRTKTLIFLIGVLLLIG